MPNFYQRWIENWETRLTTRDTNRVVRPLEWGMDWVKRWPGTNGACPADPAGCEPFLLDLNERIIQRSDDFFAYRTPADFRLERRPVEAFATGSVKPKPPARKQEADFLRFTSAVETPYPENNLVNARWFPARSRRAVVVVPHWNADALSHNTLCRVFNWMGIAALRMSKPYHDIRKPLETERADYAVSANIARTMDAVRQAVTDIRSCLDWLQMQGYGNLGIVGTSLGSCYAFLASAHDPRLRVNAFNHASTYFADVVWTGQSTRHIRAALEQTLDLERLRRLWRAISPMSYFHKFAGKNKKCLLIYGKYDLTFLPQFSRQVAAEFSRYHIDCQVAELPCGHYTMGEAPWKFIDGYQLANFLRTAF